MDVQISTESTPASSVPVSSVPANSTIRPHSPKLSVAVLAIAIAIAVIAVLLAVGAGLIANHALAEAKKARAELSDTRFNADNLQTQLAALETKLGSLRSRQALTAASVAEINKPGGLSSAVAAVQTQVDTLKAEIDGVSSTVGGLGGFGARIDAIARCVDTYMDTVAKAGGGRYTYYKC